ncbi:MAG: hypothetical protein M1820_009937 [Bogoriella megaspora]|nr:MAG: hypothetical protein M1820_009937 [Bogoriella megaspora]
MDTTSQSGNRNIPTNVLTQEEFNKYYRQNVRQQTRGVLGLGISGAMATVLPYMALPTAAAGYSVYRADKARDKLAEYEKLGFKTRKRDVVSGLSRGAAEKLALSFLLMGHDDLLLLNQTYGAEHLTEAHSELLQAGPIGDINEAINEPVQDVQQEYGVATAEERLGWFPYGGEAVAGWHGMNVAEDVVAAGVTAAAVEFAVNRPFSALERPPPQMRSGTYGQQAPKHAHSGYFTNSQGKKVVGV